MKSLTLSTTATQAGATPFAQGFEVAGVVFGAGKIQGSDDGTNYTDLVTGTASDLTVKSFLMPAYVKTSSGGAFLLADV